MSVPPITPSTDAYGAGTLEVTQEDKTLALIAYLGGAFVSFIVPLVLYLVKKDQSKFVAYHAMQALIFHVAILIGYMISGALTVVLVGFLLLPVVGILSLVFSIIAALAAYRGEWYEIPLVGKYARQFANV